MFFKLYKSQINPKCVIEEKEDTLLVLPMEHGDFEAFEQIKKPMALRFKVNSDNSLLLIDMISFNMGLAQLDEETESAGA